MLTFRTSLDSPQTFRKKDTRHLDISVDNNIL